MLRSLCPALLGLALLAVPAAAQTKPATRKPTATKTRMAPNNTRAAQPRDDAKGTGVSGYAAPGEPIQDPRYNGKNTPPYDGPAAAPAKRNTTLSTPK